MLIAAECKGSAWQAWSQQHSHAWGGAVTSTGLCGVETVCALAGLLHALVLGLQAVVVLGCFMRLCWSALRAYAALLPAIVLGCFMRLCCAVSRTCAGLLHALVLFCFMQLCCSATCACAGPLHALVF
jgi:hypothetical protein